MDRLSCPILNLFTNVPYAQRQQHVGKNTESRQITRPPSFPGISCVGSQRLRKVRTRVDNIPTQRLSASLSSLLSKNYLTDFEERVPLTLNPNFANFFRESVFAD